MEKKTTKSIKRLVKFIDAYDGAYCYLDPTEVSALKDLSRGTGANTLGGPSNALTQIHLKGSGLQFHVTEHITIVMAILQGIDPSPAQIIFGRE